MFIIKSVKFQKDRGHSILKDPCYKMIINLRLINYYKEPSRYINRIILIIVHSIGTCRLYQQEIQTFPFCRYLRKKVSCILDNIYIVHIVYKYFILPYLGTYLLVAKSVRSSQINQDVIFIKNNILPSLCRYLCRYLCIGRGQ